MTILASLREALGQYRTMREQGISQEDGIRGLDLVLRDVFPLSKFPPRCGTCEDTGWRDTLCWAEQRCGRKWCISAHPSHEHAYSVPCDCPAGDRHRRRERTADDAIATAAKVRKPRSFSRFGA